MPEVNDENCKLENIQKIEEKGMQRDSRASAHVAARSSPANRRNGEVLKMRMPAALKIAVPLFVWLAFFSIEAHAAIDSTGVFDNVLARYQAAAAGWAGYITGRATWLFWTLLLFQSC